VSAQGANGGPAGALSAASITAMQGGIAIPFGDAPAIGTMKSFVADGMDSVINTLEIKIKDTATVIDKMWLLERYVLKR
jgi:hypothetical protein